MMIFHVPEDESYNAAYGIVMMRHSQLDYIMRMAIRTFADLSIEEALDATVRDGSSSLRETVLKVARKRIGEGTPLLKLRAFLERAKRATEKRNSLAHALVVKMRDDDTGEPKVKTQFHQFESMQPLSILEALSDELVELTNELNVARLRGFIWEAIQASDLARSR